MLRTVHLLVLIRVCNSVQSVQNEQYEIEKKNIFYLILGSVDESYTGEPFKNILTSFLKPWHEPCGWCFLWPVWETPLIRHHHLKWSIEFQTGRLAEERRIVLQIPWLRVYFGVVCFGFSKKFLTSWPGIATGSHSRHARVRETEGKVFFTWTQTIQHHSLRNNHIFH